MPNNTLKGFGATKAHWIVANGPVGRGAFARVRFTHVSPFYVYRYKQVFHPTLQTTAQRIVAGALPADAKLVHGQRVNSSCYGVIYRSARLMREAPSLGGYVRAYFYTGHANALYDTQRVNNAIVSTSGASTFPPC